MKNVNNAFKLLALIACITASLTTKNNLESTEWKPYSSKLSKEKSIKLSKEESIKLSKEESIEKTTSGLAIEELLKLANKMQEVESLPNIICNYLIEITNDGKKIEIIYSLRKNEKDRFFVIKITNTISEDPSENNSTTMTFYVSNKWFDTMHIKTIKKTSRQFLPRYDLVTLSTADLLRQIDKEKKHQKTKSDLYTINARSYGDYICRQREIPEDFSEFTCIKKPTPPQASS